MHAHNELTVLNRLFTCTIEYPEDADKLHSSAQTVHLWCLLGGTGAPAVSLRTIGSLSGRAASAVVQTARADLRTRVLHHLAAPQEVSFYDTTPLLFTLRRVADFRPASI